ncbi:unnamed protein product [Caenorhabditis bovis]|uniref:Potassium channel domain-containing protein n=1 Tax=Caenorhabditis bovis TaxID=2654633 RepID=A0A8S1E9S9_9PELO|nr:unnamed protein product [Caenorhabditis bovis]
MRFFFVLSALFLLVSATSLREKRQCGCSAQPTCSCQQSTPQHIRFKIERSREDAIHERNHHTVAGTMVELCSIIDIVAGGHHEMFHRLPIHVRRRLQNKNDAESTITSIQGALSNPGTPTIRRFDRSLYWLVMNRNKFGFRRIVLSLLVLLYTLFGATVFYFIEGNYEKEILKVHAKDLDVLLDELADVLSETVNNPNKSVTLEGMKDFIKQAYITLQKKEDQYKWSTYYKLDDLENHLKWNFGSALFFSMNVYTTTGYGTISADTVAGKVFTIVYAFCFVPVTLVILRDLGQMFLVNFTKLYAHALTFGRKLRGKIDVDDDEMIQLPIKYCMFILTIYLLFCTTLVYIYDGTSGPNWNEGLSYFTAFYFSFISLSTIGLGDVMPNNVPYAPVISILFFIGMAVTKVVNRSTYIAVENGIFGWVHDHKTRYVNIIIIIIITVCDFDFLKELVAENNFTIRSIATFMRSNADIYGGGFGRVTMRRGDLLHHHHHLTMPSGGGVRRMPNIPSASELSI